jgi:hypothetical protein
MIIHLFVLSAQRPWLCSLPAKRRCWKSYNYRVVVFLLEDVADNNVNLSQIQTALDGLAKVFNLYFRKYRR